MRGFEADTRTAKVWWRSAGGDRRQHVRRPGLIRLLNIATGVVKWTRTERSATSLTGEPPHVSSGAALLVAVYAITALTPPT
jgi:hypothetical protein